MAGLRLEIRIDDKGTATLKRVEGAHKKLEDSVVRGSNRMSRSAAFLQARWQALKQTVGRAALFLKLALAAVGVAAVITGAKFEAAMTNVAAVSGATEVQLAKLSATARGLGATTAFTAAEAGEAMMSLAQAGQSVGQIIQTTGSVLLFAGAASTSLQDSAETLVQTLAQFGLEASQANRVVNVFAASMATSLLNAERLREGLSQVGATASAVGLSLEQTVGALGQLNNAGMLGGAAGTRLKNVLVRLAAPNTILKKLLGGVAFQGKNLAEVMEQLAKSGAKPGAIFQAFGRIAGPAALTFMQQGAAAADKMTESITGTNKAQEMFDIQMRSTASQLKIFKSQVQENMIAVFVALQPVIMGAIKSLTAGLQKAKPTIVAIVIGVVKVGRAIGAAMPKIIQIGGVFLGFAAALAAVAFKAILVAKAVAVWGVVLAAITSPITLVIAGAVALTVVWIKWGDKIKEIAGKVWEDFQTMGRNIAGWAVFLWDKIKWPFEKLGELAVKAAGIFKRVFPDAAAAVESMFEVIKEKGGTAIDFVVEKGAEAAKNIAAPTLAIVNGVLTVVKTVKDKFGGMLSDIKSRAAAIAGDITLPGAQASVPNFDSHVKLWKVAQDKILAADIATGLETENYRRAQVMREVAHTSQATERWLENRLSMIQTNFDDERELAAGNAEALVEAGLNAQDQITEAHAIHGEARLDLFMENNAAMIRAVGLLGVAYDSFFSSIARGEKNMAKIRKDAIKSVRAAFIKNTAQMLKFWIVETLKGILITQTAQQAAHRKERFSAAKEGAVKAFSAFANIPIIGPILGAAAAVAAFAFLMAFQKGGLVPGVAQGRDTVPSILEPREFVVRRASAESVGTDSLEFINRTGQLPATSAGDVNLSVTVEGGGIADEMTEYLEDEVVPALAEISARGRGLTPRRRV